MKISGKYFEICQNIVNESDFAEELFTSLIIELLTVKIELRGQ